MIPGSGARSVTARRSSTSTSGLSMKAPPSYPVNPMVYMPRPCASRMASSRSVELPLVDIATAMSPARALAISCRANTRSKPTSLPSAVSTA